MPGASIASNQPSGAGSGSAGIARNDLWLTHPVNLTQGLSGNTIFQWDLLDKPPGSAAVLSSSNTASTSFTPDEIGTYRIRLTTNSGGPGNVQTLVFRARYNNVGSLSERGWAFPAFDEKADESNYNSNTRGWAEVFESILTDIRTEIEGMSSGGGSVYVYQHGGVNSGNVFSTWSGAVAALPAGLGVIEVDDSLGSPGNPQVPGATFELRGEVSLVGRGPNTELELVATSQLQNPRSFSWLNIRAHEGTITFDDSVAWVFFDECTFTSHDSATTAALVLSGSQTVTVSIRHCALALGTGSAPLFHVPSGCTLYINLFEGGNIPANSISGAGSVYISLTEGCSASGTQSGFSGSLSIQVTTLTAHVNEVDPHTQYQKESEKNAVNGYAGLDGSSKLTGSQQVYGTSGNTAVEGNDPRVPSQAENDALVGTNGTPSSINLYVTNSDPRNSNSRAPSGSATGDLTGSYPSPTINKISAVAPSANGQLLKVNSDNTLSVISGAIETPAVKTLFAGSAEESSNVWKTIAAFRFNKADVSPLPTTYTLAAFLQTSNTASEARLRLYNITDASVVTGSSLSADSTSPSYQSSALTLPAGSKDYLVQIQTETNGDICLCLGTTLSLQL